MKPFLFLSFFVVFFQSCKIENKIDQTPDSSYPYEIWVLNDTYSGYMGGQLRLYPNNFFKLYFFSDVVLNENAGINFFQGKYNRYDDEIHLLSEDNNLIYHIWKTQVRDGIIRLFPKKLLESGEFSFYMLKINSIDKLLQFEKDNNITIMHINANAPGITKEN